MIDDRNDTPSANEIKEGFVWNQKANEAGWKMYLGEMYGTDQIPVYKDLLELRIIVTYRILTHLLVN